VNGVHVELFHDIESKRAWSHAIGTMQSMWRALEEDHTLRDRGRALVHAIDQLQGWRAFVTSDPRARLTEFEQAADRARADATRAKRNLIICVALIPGSFLFLVIGALFEVITGYEASFVAVLATFMFLAGIFGTVALLAGRGSTKRKVEEREREALEFRTQLDRFNGFLADPYGGRLLEQAAEQHPAFLDQSNGAFSRG
jgi:hypothetical protein